MRKFFLLASLVIFILFPSLTEAMNDCLSGSSSSSYKPKTREVPQTHESTDSQSYQHRKKRREEAEKKSKEETSTKEPEEIVYSCPSCGFTSDSEDACPACNEPLVSSVPAEEKGDEKPIPEVYSCPGCGFTTDSEQDCPACNQPLESTTPPDDEDSQKASDEDISQDEKPSSKGDSSPEPNQGEDSSSEIASGDTRIDSQP